MLTRKKDNWLIHFTNIILFQTITHGNTLIRGHKLLIFFLSKSCLSGKLNFRLLETMVNCGVYITYFKYLHIVYIYLVSMVFSEVYLKSLQFVTGLLYIYLIL